MRNKKVGAPTVDAIRLEDGTHSQNYKSMTETFANSFASVCVVRELNPSLGLSGLS